VLQPFGRDGQVERPAIDHHAGFEVHVVGPVESGDDLTRAAVQAEHHERPVGRGHLVRPDDQALRGIAGVQPQRGIVRVVVHGVGDPCGGHG
jgi:hypothetical protein